MVHRGRIGSYEPLSNLWLILRGSVLYKPNADEWSTCEFIITLSWTEDRDPQSFSWSFYLIYFLLRLLLYFLRLNGVIHEFWFGVSVQLSLIHGTYWAAVSFIIHSSSLQSYVRISDQVWKPHLHININKNKEAAMLYIYFWIVLGHFFIILCKYIWRGRGYMHINVGA